MRPGWCGGAAVAVALVPPAAAQPADVPTLIIHGERDWTIPIGDARALLEASPASDKKLVKVPGAGHNDLMMIGRRAYFGATAELCGTTPKPA